MAIAFVAGDTATGATTAALNSTTANFAIVQAGSWPSAATTVTEGGGYSNTWTALTALNSSNHCERIFYAFLTSKGTGHTFTHNGGSPCVAVALFSGVPSDAGIVDIKQALTLAPGTVTPNANGQLIVSGCICQSSVQTAVSGGLTIVDTPVGAGGNVGGSLGYLIQTTSAPVTPAWTGGSGAVATTSLVVGSVAPPPPDSLVAFIAAGPGATGGTTTAIDTTGASLLVISTSFWTGGGATSTTVSDSKSNTWIPVWTQPGQPGGDMVQQFFYCFTPTVGTGHTFTVTSLSASGYPSIFVFAFSGMTGGAYQTRSGAGNFGQASPLATGSVTPSVNGALLLSGFAPNIGTITGLALTPTGFTLKNLAGVGGVNFPGTTAYTVQATAAAINPTWAWTHGAVSTAASTVVFLPALPPSPARVSQAVVETLSYPTAGARVSQMVVEALLFPATPGRVSQFVVETLILPDSPSRVSQMVVETLQFAPEPPPTAGATANALWMGDSGGIIWID